MTMKTGQVFRLSDLYNVRFRIVTTVVVVPSGDPLKVSQYSYKSQGVFRESVSLTLDCEALRMSDRPASL